MRTGSTTGREAARESQLLERDRELATASAAARQAAAGTGALLVVVGPPGIGKSRLLDAVAEAAGAAGLAPARAAGGELERHLGFGVVRDLLGPLARGAGAQTAAAALGAAVASDAPARAPVAGQSASEPADGPPPGPLATGDEAAALNGLLWLVADAAARRPLALLVDDAQWVDSSSLRFLAYLARRVEALPVLMVVASRERPPEAGEPALEQLRRSAKTVLRPEPLSEKAAGALLDRALGRAPAAPFVKACRTAAGGNPLLLHELATELRVRGVAPTAEQASQVRSVGPSAVGRAVAARVDTIGSEATALARAVAVLGRSAEPVMASHLAGCPPEVSADAVIALSWADVLVDERPLRFTHPMVRTAVYDALGPTERARLHRRAAELLLGADRSSDEVAAHLLATDPSGDPAVVAALREAGARAFTRGAPAATIDYLRRALAEPPPEREAPALRAMLGTAQLRLGDPGAVESLQRAVLEAVDPAQRASYSLTLGRALLVAGRGRESATVLGQAADEAAREDRELGLRLAAEALFAARLNPSTIAPARARLERWGRLEGSTAAERLALVAMAHCDALQLRCSAEDAAELAARGLAGGTLHADEGPDSATPYRASTTLALAERFDDAAAANALGLEDSRTRGSALGFALASATQAELELRRGELADAEAHAGAALDLTKESGLLAMFLPSLASPLLHCLVEGGALDQGERLLEKHGLAGQLADVAGNELMLLARGRLRIAQGRQEQGIADLREVGRRMEQSGTANPAAVPWRSTLAPILVRHGEPEEGRRLAEAELELARRWGTPRAVGVALRAAGDCESGERSVELLEEAVAVLEPSAARLEHARALVSLGAALRRAGQRQRAREPLARGAELAGRLRALALAEHATQELRVAGARPRRVERAGYAALTASERRIVLLARDGATNREIAESLWLSVKTVEMHLHNAYLKLDVGSRRELAGALEHAPATGA